MGAKQIEAIPGFLGWFDQDQAPAGAHLLGFWGVRRFAAFDSSEAVHEASGIRMPMEFDPIHETRIEVFTYYKVTARVETLYSRSDEAAKPAWDLLDPDGRWSHMIVSLVWRAVASREEADGLAAALLPLGLTCTIEQHEDYLTPGMIIENERPPASRSREATGERRSASSHPIS